MRTWLEFARMTPGQRRTADVAEMNLACAEGLPGAEMQDAQLCLKRLDEDAAYVRQMTQRHLPDFRKDPSKFENSESRFRVWMLVRSLQKHRGVRYHPDRKSDDAVFETADSFLFGILQGGGGTCASLPVYYTAIGRRLGYPLKLVEALAQVYMHLFCRWDDGKERFNIETTADARVAFPPDEYYSTGDYGRSELAAIPFLGCRVLLSETPEDELAGFLKERGLRLQALGLLREATQVFAWASAVQPESKMLRNNVRRAHEAWIAVIRKRTPLGFSG